MNTPMNTPQYLTGIASLLGHAMCPSKEERPTTVRAWWEMAQRAFDERCEEISLARLRGEATSPYPTAVWEWDEEISGVRYTTGSGRLAVTATDEEIDLLISAGPLASAAQAAGAFVREPSGLYRWVRASRRVWVSGDGLPGRWEDHPSPGSLSDPGPIVRMGYVPAGDGYWVVQADLPRPGRPVVSAGLVGTRPYVEWIDPQLAEERPDRIHLLVKIDQQVFGGALSAADQRGLLTRLTQQAAAEE